jgi:hypothetical protein
MESGKGERRVMRADQTVAAERDSSWADGRSKTSSPMLMRRPAMRAGFSTEVAEMGDGRVSRVRRDRGDGAIGERAGKLDLGAAASVLASDQAVVFAQDGGGVGGRLLLEPGEHIADARFGELAVLEAEREEELGGSAGFLGGGHVARELRRKGEGGMEK